MWLVKMGLQAVLSDPLQPLETFQRLLFRIYFLYALTSVSLAAVSRGTWSRIILCCI